MFGVLHLLQCDFSSPGYYVADIAGRGVVSYYVNLNLKTDSNIVH